MATISRRTHVFSEAFDKLLISLGPFDLANVRAAVILCRSTRSVHDWRLGIRPCPRWAAELIRLTLDERYRDYLHMTGPYRATKNQFLQSLTSTRLSASVGLHWGASANDEQSILRIAIRSDEASGCPEF